MESISTFSASFQNLASEAQNDLQVNLKRGQPLNIANKLTISAINEKNKVGPNTLAQDQFHKKTTLRRLFNHDDWELLRKANCAKSNIGPFVTDPQLSPNGILSVTTSFGKKGGVSGATSFGQLDLLSADCYNGVPGLCGAKEYEMGQQTVDSKSSDHWQANAKLGVPKHDKELPVVLMEAAVQDPQSENMVAASKCIESHIHPEVNVADKVSNITGSKRPTPECLVNPLNRCSTNNSGTGHLVYVRRRPEGELSKNVASNNQTGVTDHPQLKKLSQSDEKTETEVQMKEARCCVPDVSSISGASPRCSLEDSAKNLASVNVSSDRVNSTNMLLDNPKKVSFKHWEERYFQLQNFLQKLEHSKQENYVQMLRYLSAVDLSKHAVELEKRSIRLALEEAKEVQRIRVMDVLGKYPKNPRA